MVMMVIETIEEGVTVGERVRIARKMRGWSKAELRRMANLKSASTLTELESGAISKTHQLPEIAHALGVDVLWLQTGVGRHPEPTELVPSQEERNYRFFPGVFAGSA